jgi:hypothetical protein
VKENISALLCEIQDLKENLKTELKICKDYSDLRRCSCFLVNLMSLCTSLYLVNGRAKFAL